MNERQVFPENLDVACKSLLSRNVVSDQTTQLLLPYLRPKIWLVSYFKPYHSQERLWFREHFEDMSSNSRYNRASFFLTECPNRTTIKTIKSHSVVGHKCLYKLEITYLAPLPLFTHHIHHTSFCLIAQFLVTCNLSLPSLFLTRPLFALVSRCDQVF